MRNIKRIAAFSLAAVLSFSGQALNVWAGSPEFARTQEEWMKLRDNVVEYEELADLIHEYNVTVQKNQLDLNDKKKDDLITSDQYAQYYRDAANDARSAISGDDPVTDAKSAVSAAKADKAADDNTEDLEVYRLTYDQTEANLAAQAQTLMITYFQQKNQLESSQLQLERSEADYQTIQAKQSAGMVTQADILAAQETIQSTSVEIEKLRASVEETRQKLCVMLGWNYNDSPEIRELPAADSGHIQSLNPEADKEKALMNNYTLNINKRKLENASADITKETLKRTILSNEQNISTALVKAYQAVMQANAAYEQAVAEANLESKNMDIMKQKYQLGMVSPLVYQKQENACKTKSIAVKSAQLTLFSSVQTYDNTVNGLASTGG
ncbi:TolC family protein [Lacrimispora sp. 38-1]|uniref:TolC family protein n=1 Tax=Lacrimispora sp. 38-1 TaxID=3125778 RepID=UPI003CF6CDEA